MERGLRLADHRWNRATRLDCEAINAIERMSRLENLRLAGFFESVVPDITDDSDHSRPARFRQVADTNPELAAQWIAAVKVRLRKPVIHNDDRPVDICFSKIAAA
jgi:hypothetical protein